MNDTDLGSDDTSMLGDVADELGLTHNAIPAVTRLDVEVGADGPLSLLKWGDGEPQIVFLHGGGQNAHTWDLVVMKLGLPALAIDLPGHGHSYRRDDHNYWPRENAVSVASALTQLAPNARAVVGMSLGGQTTIRLASSEPKLVRRAIIVDVTPGVMSHNATMTREERGTTALIQDEQIFDTRDEMVERAIAASPRRAASSVRRGVINNTKQLPDGRWTWRYDRLGERGEREDFVPLWDDLASLTIPVMLVRGGSSAFVPDADAAEFARRQPSARIEVVPDSGHSIQSDQPLALTELIAAFVGS